MEMGVLQIIVTLVIILLLVKPVGNYLVKVFDYEKTGLDRFFGPLERAVYRLIGIKENEPMGWKKYVFAMLLTNFIMMMFHVYRI